MGQHLAAQAHRDALRSLRQEQGELHGQGDRLFVAAIVGELPVGGLGIEYHFQGKLGKPGLYVAGRRGAVSREYVAPVALAVYQEVFLSQLHQGIPDGSVSVGMELHGVAHDVGHLVVAAVVHALHGVQYAPLHGFQSVLYMRNGPFQYHV